MPLFSTAPPVPPQPPSVSQCRSAEGNVIPECATYTFLHQQKSVQARFSGKVVIDLKSDDVLSVAAGGTADVEESAGKSSRRLTVANGKTTWFVDGAERPFDANAKHWLREVLSTMPARPVPPSKPVSTR